MYCTFQRSEVCRASIVNHFKSQNIPFYYFTTHWFLYILSYRLTFDFKFAFNSFSYLIHVHCLIHVQDILDILSGKVIQNLLFKISLLKFATFYYFRDFTFQNVIKHCQESYLPSIRERNSHGLLLAIEQTAFGQLRIGFAQGNIQKFEDESIKLLLGVLGGNRLYRGLAQNYIVIFNDMVDNDSEFRLSTSNYALRTLEHRDRFFSSYQGSRLFVLTDDQSSNSQYRGTFPIVLQRLQLENRNDFLVTGCLRNIETYHAPGTLLKARAFMNYNSAISSFQYYIDASKAGGSFTSMRLNYIAYSRTLYDRKNILHIYATSSGNPSNCPNFNGLSGLTVGFCTISIVSLGLTTTSYNLFPFLIANVGLYAHSNAALSPFSKLEARLLSTTSLQLKRSLQYFSITQYSSMNIMFIRDDLFENSPKKNLIFSYNIFEQQPNTITPTSFTLSFPQFLSDKNLFIGVLSYRGFRHSFGIYPTSPPSTDLEGASRIIGNALSIFAVTFYGYSESCPTYLTMGCQPCPQYCQTCHVWPTFHCAQCTPSFVLSADQLSCTCPFSILNNLCGTFSPHCQSAKFNQSSVSAVCASCDIQKGLILVGNDCQCKTGYFFNATMNLCQEFCGDGIAINAQCDDGNPISGDGCSSSCLLQSGFLLDYSTSPPSLKTQILLKYKVIKIIRHETENSAKIFLSPVNAQSLPFSVLTSQFEPVSSQIKFKIILSQIPYKERMLDSFTLLSIDQTNQMIIDFAFDFSIEGFQGQISLDYKKTQYKNQIQTLSFELKGNNYALKATQNAESYKAIGNTMLAAIILNIICFLTGLMSFKFIGVESILTLQIIYFCQLLIFDISNWPSGFSFLKNLKYSFGFNDVLNNTEYRLFNTLAKKMHALQIKKLLIENFNINFLILAVSFLVFLVFSVLRKNRETYVNKELREMKYRDEEKKEEAKIEEFRKESFKLLDKLNKLNEIAFSISNQISFWQIIPLILAVSAEFLIPNIQFTFIEDNSQHSILIKARGQILLISLIMILCVVLNNFKNAWLSLSSHNKLMEKPEELHYRRALFLYLLVIGLLVCFCNCKKIGPIYFSVIVLAVHIVFMLALIKIKPYRQSLKVHTVTLFFNNGVVLVFLVVIYLLNYVEDLDEVFVLGFGFFLTGASGVILFLTFVRFYYDLRYGKELEQKIMIEREKQKEKLEIEKQMKLKSNEQKLQRQAEMKKTQQQKNRENNCYLIENQQREHEKMNLLEWVESRQWDQKMKDKTYFESFEEKPLQYLEKHDQKKYEEVKKGLEMEKEKAMEKKKKQEGDPEYQLAVQRLRSEFNKKKGKGR